MSSDCKILKVMSLIMQCWASRRLRLAPSCSLVPMPRQVSRCREPVLTAQVAVSCSSLPASCTSSPQRLASAGEQASKIGASYFIFAVIVLVGNIVEIALVEFGGSGSTVFNVVLAGVALAGIVFASKARKAAQDRLS